MPTRNNPNLPSSLNRRVLSHKRIALRARSRSALGKSPLARGTASTINTHVALGVVRGATVSSKKARKVLRTKNFAAERRKAEMAEELLKKEGEVVMVDAATVTLSKRQQKLADRAEKAREMNAKARAAAREEEAEKAKNAAEKGAEEAAEEAAMEVDDV